MNIEQKLTAYADLSRFYDGQSVSIVACIEDVRDIGNKEDPKTQIICFDSKQNFSLIVWQEFDAICNDFVANAIYLIHGQVIVRKSGRYIKLSYAESLSMTEDLVRKFMPNKYRELTSINRHFFIASLGDIKDARYRSYVEHAYGLGDPSDPELKRIFVERQTKQFDGFCSINHHDNYRGGEINHVVDLIRLILLLRQQYGAYGTMPTVGRVERGSGINWDYLLTLASLHDVGKNDTYIIGMNDRVMFNSDCKLTHNEMGILYVNEIHNELSPDMRLSPAEVSKLYKGILCHDSTYTGRKSDCIEDEIFSHLDALDAIFVDTLIL